MGRSFGLDTLFLENFRVLKCHYYLCSFFSDLSFAVLGAPDGGKEEPILRRQMIKNKTTSKERKKPKE